MPWLFDAGLFDAGLLDRVAPAKQEICPGLAYVPRFADEAALAAVLTVMEAAPPRRMATPRGKLMSVAITNCGTLGWVTDRQGYRYTASDPLTGNRWPPLPQSLDNLARRAAEAAGFDRFIPDACLINLYEADAKMGLHQDKDESDFGQPIVSVSFGMSARFRFGGDKRTDPAIRLMLHHGDVVVFGGPARLAFHGIDRLIGDPHPQFGARRINLTFRKAGSSESFS